MNIFTVPLVQDNYMYIRGTVDVLSRTVTHRSLTDDTNLEEASLTI